MLVSLAMLLAAQGSALPAYAVPRLEGVTIPGLPAVTGHICVDQFGYLPDGAKVAVISDPQKGYNASDHYTPGHTLQVRRRSDDKTVFSGLATVWKDGATDESSGDKGWWFDFSSLKEPGEYYVYDVSNRMRSPVFKIGEKVFDPVLKAACRMYYFQRLATPIEAKYAEGPWVDGAAYLQDKQTRSVEAKDDRSKDRDLSGGWMDAGDTDKYPPFNGDVIHPLLYAYTANPKAFTDDFNIPESGNGLPDLLDEVKYQLDWLLKMQFPDGSVPVKMGQIDYNGKWPLSEDTRPRYYGPKDSGATIYTCAIFAHAARVYSKFKPWSGYSVLLTDRAKKAWYWYSSNPRTYKTDTGEIKSGIANRSAEEQDRMEAFAAVHLFALTGDETYNKAVVAKAGAARQLTEYLWSPYESGAAEALVDYMSLPGADAGLVKKIKDVLVRSAASDQFAPDPSADLYRAWMSKDNYHWGSNFVRAAWGVVALQAAHVVDSATAAKLRVRAAGMLHSFHGVNPLSCVYLSNMKKYGAELSVMHIYHERYGVGSKWDGNPPPGYIVGGPNQSFGGKAADGKPSVEWVKGQPRGKAYMDTALGWPESSWELSEPAIYYQAMYVRLLAEFAK
ncbi:MAG: glycoside hydrolase family 9 protein [Armatimonadetes bacterium]|nr:glycoside hydrolase family 9 protein [Armatimonadota bacterium]